MTLCSTRHKTGSSRLPLRCGYTPAIGTTPKNKHLIEKRVRESEDLVPFDATTLAKDAETTIDTDGRHWPTVYIPRDGMRDLQNTLKEQKTELLARCVQIADLYNKHQQQAAELEIAHEAIAGLDKAVTVLRKALAQQEGETAAAHRALALADDEKNSLRAQVGKAINESIQLQETVLNLNEAADSNAARLRLVEAALSTANGKIATLAVTATETNQRHNKERDQQKAQFAIERNALEVALAGKEVELEELNIASKEAIQRYQNELNLQKEQFAFERKTLEDAVTAAEMQLNELKSISMQLLKRCNYFVEKVSALEATNKIADDKIRSQADNIVLLETLLRVEREGAELK
jgi:chromosome segregation ATPase